MPSRMLGLGLVAFMVMQGCGATVDEGDLGITDVPDAGFDDGAGDPGAMAVTSATPMVAQAILGDGHSGWKKADCTACHIPEHGGLAAVDCVVCHGMNGAPVRPVAHRSTGCDACHATSHGDVEPAFHAPRDCLSCHRFAPSTICPATEEYDVVVIGAGGGGLAAAATLAKGGMSVALVEKHNRVGGYMTNFRRGDYRFEISLHAMGGFDEPFDGTSRMFQELGIRDRVKPVKADSMYWTVYPDFTFEVPDGFDAYRQALLDQFPDEAAGIMNLFQDLLDTYHVLEAYTAEQAGEGDAFTRMMAEKPDAVARFLGWMGMTLTEALAEYISSPQLFAVFTQLACYVGSAPDELSALYYLLMWNGYHLGGFYNFEGGSESISEALAEVIRENGGTIKLGTLATRIVLDEEGRAVEVRTKDDACLRTRYVVSNANAPATVEMVGRENLPATYVQAIDEMDVGLPTVVLYVGTDRDYVEEFGGAHEIILQDTYDPSEVFKAVTDCDPEKTMVLIANYSVMDPTAAPEGKNAISITGQLDDACNDDWKWADRAAYKQYKAQVAEVYLRRVEAVLPDLRKHVEVLEVGGPQTNRAFSLNPRGSIYGWSHPPYQSILDRLPQETPIPNLFLAGAWTFPGAGQSAVLSSGLAAGRMILDLEAE